MTTTWYKSHRAGYLQSKKKYYEKNRFRLLARAKIIREQRLAKVWALKDHPCTDCGQKFHPVCMDFDHRDAGQKVAGIGALTASFVRFEKLLGEIAKCDLVCANCHRLRTYSRYHLAPTDSRTS